LLFLEEGIFSQYKSSFDTTTALIMGGTNSTYSTQNGYHGGGSSNSYWTGSSSGQTYGSSTDPAYQDTTVQEAGWWESETPDPAVYWNPSP
jgi:hypothetical protein